MTACFISDYLCVVYEKSDQRVVLGAEIIHKYSISLKYLLNILSLSLQCHLEKWTNNQTMMKLNSVFAIHSKTSERLLGLTSKNYFIYPCRTGIRKFWVDTKMYSTPKQNQELPSSFKILLKFELDYTQNLISLYDFF